MQKPLFTVAIISFRQYDIIRECIDSVLAQDYPNMELIVCNDATDDFDREAISDYISEHKKDNIKHFCVVQNPERLGTVKNANQVLCMAEGEYLKLIAADDALWWSGAISEYAEVFGSDAVNVVCGRCLVVDNSGLIQKQYPSVDDWELIAKATPAELFEANVHTNIIHSPGVALRKSFWIEMGRFNENYYLAEDWPLWLKISRLGHKFHIVKTPAVKYRYGGVSNSSAPETKKYKQECWKDIVNVIENEILPYRDLLKPKTLKTVKRELNLLKLLYFRDFLYRESRGKARAAHNLALLLFCMERLLREIFKKWRSKLVLKSVIAPFAAATAFLLVAISIKSAGRGYMELATGFQVLAILCAAYCVLMGLSYIGRKFSQMLKWIKKKLIL